MKGWKILLLLTPLLLYLLLVAASLAAWLKAHNNVVDIYAYATSNSNLLISGAIVFMQTILGVGIVTAEMRDRLVGTWEVDLNPSTWKSGTNTGRVAGTGRLYVARARDGRNQYRGHMHLTYVGIGGEVVLRGLYEVWLSARRHTVTGRSRICWREEGGHVLCPVPGPVGLCIYSLRYDGREASLSGQADMQSGNTKQFFEARRL